MRKQVEIDGRLYELKAVRTTKAKKLNVSNALAWWTKREFKVTQEGLKYTAKNGKVYNAIKGIDKNGKELFLKYVYGGSRLTPDNF